MTKLNKNLVFYTNCQGGLGVNKLLNSIYTFKSVNYIQTYSLIWNKKPIPKKILQLADVFIYQPINSSYDKYSTDKEVPGNILNYLRKDCIKISFPYVYMACLYPLYGPNNAAEIDGGISYDISKVVNRDIIIDLKHIHTNSEIIEMYRNNKIDFKFKKNYDNTIERLKEKEKLCDITVSHLFTMDNIKKIKLMHSNNHPTNYVLKYITNEILMILNLNTSTFENFKNEILPIYPYSIYSLNYYKFDWLKPEECDEKIFENWLFKILES